MARCFGSISGRPSREYLRTERERDRPEEKGGQKAGGVGWGASRAFYSNRLDRCTNSIRPHFSSLPPSGLFWSSSAQRISGKHCTSTQNLPPSAETFACSGILCIHSSTQNPNSTGLITRSCIHPSRHQPIISIYLLILRPKRGIRELKKKQRKKEG